MAVDDVPARIPAAGRLQPLDRGQIAPPGPGFVLALAGIRQRVVLIKAINTNLLLHFWGLRGRWGAPVAVGSTWGTSLIRNRPLEGTYSRTMPREPW